MVTLAGERGLLLVGEPGTAKSMLSELLAAAICGTSALTVQGTAGTTEDQLRYGWNYALLLAQGPTPQALVPSPVLHRDARAVRSPGSRRSPAACPRCRTRWSRSCRTGGSRVPELAGTDDATVYAAPGLHRHRHRQPARPRRLGDVGRAQAPLQLRDRRADRATWTPRSRWSAGRPGQPVERVGARRSTSTTRCWRRWSPRSATCAPAARSRAGRWSGRARCMSTAEAVAVASSLGIAAAYLPGDATCSSLVPGHLLGVVRKDDPPDQGRLLGYWDGAVRRRAEDGARAVAAALGAAGDVLDGD